MLSHPTKQILSRLLKLGLIIGAAWVFIGFVYSFIWAGSNSDWASVRLVRSFALLKGLPAFFSPGSGPLIAGLNGPTFVLGYLPAAWWSSIPSQATLIGSLLTSVYFFIPVLFVLWRLYKDKAVSQFLFSFFLFAFFSLESPSLSYSAQEIHGDALAVGLGLLAIWALTNKMVPSRLQFFLCSLFMVLSLLSKIVMAPILFSIPIGVYFFFGRRLFNEFFIIFLLVSSLLFGVCAWMFGPESLTNALGVASGVHWVKIPGDFNFYAPPAVGWMGRLKVLVSCFSELLRSNLFLALLSTASLHQLFLKRPLPEMNQPKERLKRLLLFVGLSLIPACLVSRAKFGGDVNSFTPSLYFLYLFCVINLGDWFEQETPVLKHWGPGFFLLLLWLTATRLPYALKSTDRSISHLDDRAYELITEYPNRFYFPFQPLAHLLAENKLYHSFSNHIDIPRGQEGKFRAERFALFVPENFLALAIYQPERENLLRDYFPGFEFLHEDRNYPGLKFFSKSQLFSPTAQEP